jgi:hypothetical protein|tara:strand:+ start:18 stop:488 length:471 start_codon:yes stop_codon:yes gene_type:complete
MYRKLSDILEEQAVTELEDVNCEECAGEGCDDCRGSGVKEAVGDSAESIWELCDEVGCDPEHPIFAELVRYLDGDTLQDFVSDFRRHNDMNGMEEAVVDEAEVEEDNAFNSAAANAKNAGESHFTFNGKKYKVKMDADTASSLSESIQRYKTLAGI